MMRATRLYAWLTRLLPRAVRDRDADEMVRTLGDHLAAAPRPRRVLWRALRRFPLVLALEWRDALLVPQGAVRTPRQQPRATPMDAFTRMLRQGTRSLARTPAFTLSVIVLLGLGVGSVSAIFAVVDHVLLRRMPYPSAERLFVVQNGSHSVPMLRDMVAAMPSAEAWGAASSDEANLTGEGEPQRVREAAVSDGFFAMFAARAHAGRLLHAGDFQGAPSAVLSYGAWVRLFGADSSVIGRTIRVNDRALTVVGVLDGNFAVPEGIVDANIDIWRPLDPGAEYFNNRNHWALGVAGRLRPTASLAQAQHEADRLAASRAKAFPDTYVYDGTPSPLPLQTLREVTTGDVRQGLTLLLGAVVLLLLVACANVTHLVLARGVARTREMAVRRALGANTRSLVAQLFTENLVLGVAGAVLGIAIAYGGVRVFLALMPDGLPRADAIRVDVRVLVFAAVTGIGTAIVFGLLPALRFARTALGNPLRAAGRGATGGRAAHAWRNVLVVGEVAVSLVLVAQAGWLLRSFIRLSNQELGFRTAGVVTMPMSVTGVETAAEWYTRMESVRESLLRTPGVRAASFGLTMPLEWTGGGYCCWGQRPNFPGKPRAERSSVYHPVSDDYFSMLELRLLAGASWTRTRARAYPYPAVINEALAKQTFGSVAAAVGASFTTDTTRYEVIGVVANNYHYGVTQPHRTSVYLPANTVPFSPGRVHMAVLTDRADAQLATDLRAAIWTTEPNMPVPTVRSLGAWARGAAAQQRFDSALFGVFSAVALLLVAGGLAGTLFYMVSLQRRDLGIRIALGETPAGLERRVLTRGVGLAAMGAVLGTAGAWFGGRLLEARLYGVEARDVRTLGLAVGVLMTIALMASWIPARRAAATNPLESLRAE